MRLNLWSQRIKLVSINETPDSWVSIQSKKNRLIPGVVLSEPPVTGGKQERIKISAKAALKGGVEPMPLRPVGIQDSLSNGAL